MKKNILLIFLLIAIHCSSISHYINDCNVIGIENKNFNNQKQLVFSWYQTDWENFGNENLKMYNISIGLRTFSNEKPTLIGRIMYMQGSDISPFVDKNSPLIPGDRYYTFWNRIGKGSILDFDMTDLEELYIKWLHIQRGYGFDTYNLNSTDKFLYHAFVLGKLGLSSITYGNNNFKNKSDNLTHGLALESGVKLNAGLSYKRDFICESIIDYTFYFANDIVHKISAGIKNEYHYPTLYDGYDFIKFSLDINYNKYYFDKFEEDFLKFELGISYFIY